MAESQATCQAKSPEQTQALKDTPGGAPPPAPRGQGGTRRGAPEAPGPPLPPASTHVVTPLHLHGHAHPLATPTRSHAQSHIPFICIATPLP